MTNVIEGKLSITRPMGGSSEECISIEVKDEKAVITFLEIKIRFEDFAKCLTGLSHTSCLLEVRGLDKVGKVREQNNISFEVPTYDKAKAIEEAKKHTPEGWVAGTHYGSQNSFKYLPNGGYLATTQIIRWVDRIEQEKE